MAMRGLIARIPIWARASGIVGLVLVGVVASALVLGTIRSGDMGPGHESPSGGGNEQSPSDGTGGHEQSPSDGTGGHEQSPGGGNGGHGEGSSDGNGSGGGHSLGQGDLTGPTEPGPAAGQVVTFIIDGVWIGVRR
jgi:hypothetical protein